MFTDEQIFRGYGQTVIPELIHLADEDTGVKHYSIADEACLPVVEYPGGNEMKDILLVIDNQRVSGIVAALKTYHTISLFGKQVDDFPFSFVSPLGPNDNDICHAVLFPVALALEQGRAWTWCKTTDLLSSDMRNRTLMRK
jgi:hypothetical protein